MVQQHKGEGPGGGQFMGVGRDENTSLDGTSEAIPDGHRGVCAECSDGVAVVGGVVTHSDPAGDEGHEPSFDMGVYDGDAATVIAQAESWGDAKWDDWEDTCADRRREEDAAVRASAAAAEVRASVTAGVDLSGTPEQIRDSAMKAISDATTIYESAGVMALAADILGEYPDAWYVELDDSDQEDCSFSPGRILDAAGETLTDDFDEFEDHYGLISDLPGRIPTQGEPGFTYLELTGSRRQGYTGRLNLRAAAALDLKSLIT